MTPTTRAGRPSPSTPSTGDPASRVTPLARAKGAQVGVRYAGLRGLETDLGLWRLDLASELLVMDDAGTTEATRPSRRWGIK